MAPTRVGRRRGVDNRDAQGGSPIALGETQQFDNGACPTHFSPCAFQIAAAGLMPGVTYTLTASARSTVTGATSAAATLEVTIASKSAADVTPLGTTIAAPRATVA